MREVEAVLTGDPDAESLHLLHRGRFARFYLSLNPDLPNSSFAKVVIMTSGPEARERLRDRLLARLRRERFAHPRGRVNRLDFGPPVGFPVQFRVSGPIPKRSAGSPMTARRRSATIRMSATPTSTGTSARRSVRLAVDQDRARCSA